jgi:hypothetical protein
MGGGFPAERQQRDGRGRGWALVAAWAAVWLLTRAFILAQVGVWNHHQPIQWEDVGQFMAWAEEIVETGKLPASEAWQYPPGAAFLLLLPRVGGDGYGGTFVALMLVADLAGLALLAAFGERRRNFAGVWIWLLGIPLLATLPLLRFDVVPTVMAVGALLALHRRPGWFGALAGAGASLKLWPVVVLFGEWDRRRLLRSAAIAAGVVLAVVGAAQLAFGDALSFLGEQGGRGLQVEAVAALPWQLGEVVSGTPIPESLRHGAWEITSSPADTVASLLDLASIAVFAVAALWWMARDAALRSGRFELGDETLARDFVFGIVLAFVVVSRVLSPQYCIWLLGVAAVVLTDPATRLRRPAYIVLFAVVLTPYSLSGSTGNTVIRNVTLLLAFGDAWNTLWRALPPGALRGGLRSSAAARREGTKAPRRSEELVDARE